MIEVLIRWLKVQDCVELFEMVKLFNEDLNIKEEPTITSRDLEIDGFSTPPMFYCVVAESNSKMIGYCVFNTGYDTNIGKRIYIEELFVNRDRRGIGIGSGLVKSVTKYAKENGFSRISLISNKSTGSIYSNMDFENETVNHGYEYYSLQQPSFDNLLLKTNNNSIEITFEL